MQPSPHYRRNFIFNVSNGVFWNVAEAFANDNIVTAVFLSQLTSSNLLISLLSPIRTAGWFLPQFFVAPVMARFPIKTVFYNRITVLRIAAWVVLIAAMLLLTDKAALLIAFFVCISLIALSDGLGGLPFMIIVQKTIPPNRRGMLFAWRNGLGAVFGILGGALLSFLLGSQLPFPANYAAAYTCAGIAYALCYFAFGAIKEPKDDKPEIAASFREQLPLARTAVQTNPSYRNFLLARCAIMFGAACMPFFTVFAKRNAGLSDAFLGSMVSVMIASALVSNLIFGRLSARVPSRTLVILSTFMGLALCATGALMVVLPAISTGAVVLAFALIGCTNAVNSMSVGLLTIDLAPAEQRSMYIGLTNTVVGIAMISRGVVGALVDVSGFVALFALCAVAYALAIERLLRVKV